MGQNAPSQVHHTSRIAINNTSGGANSQPMISGPLGSFALPGGVGNLQYNLDDPMQQQMIQSMLYGAG